MVNATIERELHEQLEQLPSDRQRQVLDFARALATSRLRGVPGTTLLSFAGSIPPEDLSLMLSAIQRDCELVDPHEW